VLSQLTHAVVGHGFLYYVAIAALLAVLTLSANTSFADFPRLCRTVAADRFLPKSFAIAGRRLVFSVGILYLTATAGLLLIVFGGITGSRSDQCAVVLGRGSRAARTAERAEPSSAGGPCAMTRPASITMTSSNFSSRCMRCTDEITQASGNSANSRA
jgi:hypothetical protein